MYNTDCAMYLKWTGGQPECTGLTAIACDGCCFAKPKSKGWCRVDDSTDKRDGFVIRKEEV